MKRILFVIAMVLAMMATVGCHKVKVPAVVTVKVSYVSDQSCLVEGEVTSDGGDEIIEKGVCWGIVEDPLVTDAHQSCGMGEGVFSCEISGLTAETSYWFRAYAINDVGVGYGNSIQITTLPPGDLPAELLPTVTTIAVTDVTQTSCKAIGRLEADGGSPALSMGVCWDTAHLPTLENSFAYALQGVTGTFSCDVMGLSMGTSYYVRAFACNEIGIGYGDELELTTQSGTGGQPTGYPQLGASEVQEVGQTTAVFLGDVLFDGGGMILERGFCYGTRPNPTINDRHVVASTVGTGAFGCEVDDLQPWTRYYVRSYAKNQMGLSYGTLCSFRTLTDMPWAYPGALNGVFSVSDEVEVVFSQGNLQYHPYHGKWRFALGQSDRVGLNNNLVTNIYNGWIDLFGWGTSGYPHGAVCYQPWSTSVNAADYSAYGQPSSDLCDQTGFADWGINAIENGGNEAYCGWRTLTKDEWNYLLHQRHTLSGVRFAAGNVEQENGLLLFPDDWDASSYPLNCPNEMSVFDSNAISDSDWHTMERQGVVFLPAAGMRAPYLHHSVLDEFGQYWSSTSYFNHTAYAIEFTDRILLTNQSESKCHGLSVRLVRPIR